MIKNSISGAEKEKANSFERENQKEIITIKEKTPKLRSSKFNEYIQENKNNFFENFEILDMIGFGSESEVYKARIKNNKREVALKMISLKEHGMNCINEINISRKMKNKNVINYYLASELKKNEMYCIIMEYAKHGNLREFQKNLIGKDYLSESVLCFLTYQILNGLKYIHLNKIAHMDLKPENIIIDDLLNVKIIDFSISIDYKKLSSDTIKLPLRGTSFYMAPEVLRTDTIQVSDLNKVDLFSLGVVLYRLAFGNFPFGLIKDDSKKYAQILNKINKDFKVVDDDHYYSSHFLDFISKLIEKDINKRINIFEALNHYWVKGAEILLSQKEQIFNAGNFLGYLVTDHFKQFDDYIKNHL